MDYSTLASSVITGVATIAKVLVNKAEEKVGQNIGDAVWKKGVELYNKLRDKKKVPSLTTALDENETQRIDYGQAVLELKAAAEEDPEIAETLLEVEEAVKNDQSETGKNIQAKAEEIKNQPSVINHFSKLAEEIKAEKGAMVAQSITIQQQNNTYT